MLRAVRMVVEEKWPRWEAFYREIVGVNSFTRNPKGVERNAELVESVFRRELGFDVVSKYEHGCEAEKDLVGCPERGPHLLMGRKPIKFSSNSGIAFVSHLDTVFPEELEVRNGHVWEDLGVNPVHGREIRGPGVCDIKGGTLGILMVLSTLKEVMGDKFDTVYWHVWLDAAEETMDPTFPACVEDFVRRSGCQFALEGDGGDGCKMEAALVFEASQMTGYLEMNRAIREEEGYVLGEETIVELPIISSRKGMTVMEISVSGKSAHAGNNHGEGESAILALAHLIVELEKLNNDADEVTVNVGRIEGGTTHNTVPSEAKLLVEIRARKVDVLESVRTQALMLCVALDQRHDPEFSILRAPFEQSEKIPSLQHTPKVNVRVQENVHVTPWERNEGSDFLVNTWDSATKKLAEEHSLPRCKVTHLARGGLSDGNRLWNLVPTIDALGVAGKNAHCSKEDPSQGLQAERAFIDSFLSLTTIHTTAILSLLNPKSPPT